jgi:hypothetical protein
MEKITKSQAGKFLLENKLVFVDVKDQMWLLHSIEKTDSGIGLKISYQHQEEHYYYPKPNEKLEFFTPEVVFNEKVYVEVEGGVVSRVLAKEGIDVHVRDIDAESEMDGNVVSVFDENNATEKEIHQAITAANKAQVENIEYSNK